MKNVLYIVWLVVLGTAQLAAQNNKDFKLLKGEKEVEVVFSYDNLRLQAENFTEEEYIQRREMEINKKNPGSAEEWKKTWEDSKETLWPAKFLNAATKYNKSKIRFTTHAPKSTYIILVEVTWIYQGWDAGIGNQPAKVTSTVKLVSREQPTLVLAEHTFTKKRGNEFANFSNEIRIGWGFDKTGKEFGKKLAKELR